jgi:hypothetical protein
VSRRHHGGRPHRSNGHARPVEPGRDRPNAAPASAAPFSAPAPATRSEPPVAEPRLDPAVESEASPVVAMNGHAADHLTADDPHHDHDVHGSNGGYGPGLHGASGPNAATGCTAPQLRRFIKSRPYVPMHELRRRFGIDGHEDDMTAVDLQSGRVFVGLPRREGLLLGELLRGGEIGYELSLDPRSPVVVGLYPMRPVARA